jgi:magnesium and cobalt transporter
MSSQSSSSPDPSSTSRWWSRLFHGRGDEAREREEIADFLAECRRHELIGSDEYAMLQGVLEVSETQVRDIMIPRSHMVVVGHDDPPDVVLKTIVESGHSRFPVISGDRDQVIGILLAKDLLKYFAARIAEPTHGMSQPFRIEELLRTAAFIPESKRLNRLLTEFRESHNHMAIVVDEYGGVAGLATIEDVLEQIVGEIDDEHDPEEAAHIQSQGDSRYIVAGLTRIEAFNEFFGSNLSDEEYDTVAGLIMHELGRLPRRGEQVTHEGFRFKVLRADRRRIQSVEVMRVEQDAAQAADPR